MISLIKQYIQRSHYGYNDRHPDNLPYKKVWEQVLTFLTDRYASKHHRKWLRALVAILNQTDKVRLMGDLLTEARDNQGVVDRALLIDVAMEIIYPPSALHRVNTEVKSEREEGNHYYISFNHRQFAKTMEYWSKKVTEPINFFDVGCGLGDKLVLAHWFVEGVESVTGVEINTHVYNLSKFFIGNLYKKDFPIPLSVTEGDAFDVDYHPYNLIYMYQPIADSRKMIKLYQHISETMPVGGLMIEVFPSHYGETIDWIEALCEREDLLVLDRDHYLVVKKVT